VSRALVVAPDSRPAHERTQVYYGSEYNAQMAQLPDLSGNMRHADVRGNGAALTSEAGNGATQAVTFLQGRVDTKVVWPEMVIPSTFTICSVTRWTSAERAQQGRILSSLSATSSLNWLHGHDQYGPGAAYYGDGYKARYDDSLGAKTDWVVLCGTNDADVGRPGNVIYEQVERATANGGRGGGYMHINDWTAQRSDFALHSVLIWDRGLSPAQMKTVTRALVEDLRGVFTPSYQRVVPEGALLDLLAARPPSGVYFAAAYDEGAGVLPDLSGFHRDARVVGNGATRDDQMGHGANLAVPALQGGKDTQLHWPEASIPSTFTVCSVTRWTSTAVADQKRVLSCYDASGGPNWLHGAFSCTTRTTTDHPAPCRSALLVRISVLTASLLQDTIHWGGTAGGLVRPCTSTVGRRMPQACQRLIGW